MKIKLCFFTGSRADYGLLFPLIKRALSDSSFRVSTLVSGSHLSPEFGNTVRAIEKDGIRIDEKVEVLISGDSSISTTKSVGLGLISYSESLSRLNPDWLIVLGDRFEAMAVALASHFLGIPITHISGGEVTIGAYDDALRHSITKLSYLHFASTEEYRNRIIQLGESPNRVFNVGALGIEALKKTKLLSKKRTEAELKFSLDNLFLVTYHPVTLEKASSKKQMQELLKALEEFTDYHVIFTMPNADMDGRIINQMITEYVKKNQTRCRAFVNLGRVNYLSILQFAKVVIGNSSSGITEVPHFKIPTINIGERQTGRIKPSTVIDSTNDARSIALAIRKALSPSFRSRCQTSITPYEKENTSGEILKHIKIFGKVPSLKKSFYDLE